MTSAQCDPSIGVANRMIAISPTSAERTEAHPEDDNDRGIALTRQGKFDEAETCFREAVRARPDFPEAHNNLGNVLVQLGRHEEAIACYREALRFRPDYPKAHNNLGNALRAANRLDDAETEHRTAIAAVPNSAEFHNDLGITLVRRGKLDAAASSFNEALKHRPDHVEAIVNLGTTVAKNGRIEAAEAHFRQALRYRPNHVEAHFQLGNVLARQNRREEAAASYHEAIRLRPEYAKAHHYLASLLAKLGRFEEAETSFDEAVRIEPHNPDVLNDHAIFLNDRGRFEQAAARYREAIRLRPNCPEVHNNLGNTLRQLGQLKESLACYDEALRLRSNYPEAHNNRGIVLRAMNRLDEAAASYTKALQLRPDYADAHVNRSMAWLRAGRFELGWPEYEWRWRKPETPPPKFIQPAWNGAPLKGRTILLYTEQGWGDTFQFIRYAPLVAARGGRVILQCQPALIPLLSRCVGIDRLVPRGDPLPDFDVHAALMSLPGIFYTDSSSIPAEIPYLFADEDLINDWRRRLADIPGLRIGVVWQGNPKFANDLARSFPLKDLEPLARVPGVSLVSLQVHNGLDQLTAIDFRALDLSQELMRAPGIFTDAAAVIRNLDMVIACDTAIAHLAGGLGMPVWLALPWSPCWRWLMNRIDTPWYPTMRLFRQTTDGDWGIVFRRMAGELRELLRINNRSTRTHRSARPNRRRAPIPQSEGATPGLISTSAPPHQST